VTVGWQEAPLPAGSTAEHEPGDAPSGKKAVAQAAVQLQLSVQVALGVTEAPPFAVHSTVWFAQVTPGFCESTTRMYDVQLSVVDESTPVATTGIA
jgi:hypothetical protein